MSAVLDRYDVGVLPGSPPFGAMVRGLTSAHLDDPSVHKSLNALWVDKGVLLFRDGEHSPEMQVKLARCFGPHQRSGTKEKLSADSELTEVAYDPEDGNLWLVNGKVLGGYLPWHTDQVYTDTLNRGAILRAVKLPATGGMTGFIDKILAYQRLPDDLKARIEGLHVVYFSDLNIEESKFGNLLNVRLLREGKAQKDIRRLKFKFPRTLHPMVFEQPGTGRKILNVSPWFAQGVYEMGGSDGDNLLSEVIAHAISDAIAYYHQWRIGDMLLWDNWRTLHSAPGAPENSERLLVRAMIGGEYTLGRNLDGPSSKPKFDV